MEPALAERAQQLKRWVIDAFQEHEDSDEIECAIIRLAKGRPDPDGADDGHILRVLQHPDLPICSAYTVLGLLSRRRGAGGVGADTTTGTCGADQAFLGEMVWFLAHSEDSPLQQCMMAYRALFPPPDLPRADLVLGGSLVAESLHHGNDHSKQKAARLVVRLHELYEEREPIAAVTEKIAERFVEVDDIQAFVGFHGLVSKEALGSMAEVRGRLPGVTALDFGWVYRSIVADSDRRREQENRAQAEEMARELGWGPGGDGDAGSGTGRASGGSGGRDDDDGAHGQAGAQAGAQAAPEGAVQHSGGARIEEGRAGPSEGGAAPDDGGPADMDVDAPIPIDQIIIDDVLRKRYRWYRTESEDKKQELPDSEEHPGWKDAAWKAREGWRILIEEWPGVKELWKLDDNVATIIAELRARTASKQTIASHLKHISTFLTSLQAKEHVWFFGSSEDFERCRAAAKRAEDVVGLDDGGAADMDVDGGENEESGQVVADAQELPQPADIEGARGGEGASSEEGEGIQQQPVPITQEEVDDILRERYRWNRTHKKGKDGKDQFGAELVTEAAGQPGWKDAAWQTRNTLRRHQKEMPGFFELWNLGNTIGELVVRSNGKGKSNHSADTTYKHISAFLNSNLTEEEKLRYFGSPETYEDCVTILKTAWKGVKQALRDTVKNAEYTSREREVPSWRMLKKLAADYINNNAAPLKIETVEQAKLVRRLYGLRVTITEHVPRRREVFKVTPRRLVELDAGDPHYVDPATCNYVDGSGVLRLNVYKTSSVYGEYALQLSPAAWSLIALLEDYAERENLDSLFGSVNNLSNVLYDIYEPALGVRVGCGTLRRKYISSAVAEGRLTRQRDQVELSRKMGHSVWMQLFYYAKGENAAIPIEERDGEGLVARPDDEPAREESSGATECIVVDSGDDDGEGQGPASSSGGKRPAGEEGVLAPAWKKVKAYRKYPTKDQTDALRDIIRKEREDGKDGKRITWRAYTPLYAVLRDVDPESIRAWGNTERNKMDGVKKKQSPRRKGGEAEDSATEVEREDGNM
jgi:hypothetical protein